MANGSVSAIHFILFSALFAILTNFSPQVEAIPKAERLDRHSKQKSAQVHTLLG